MGFCCPYYNFCFIISYEYWGTSCTICEIYISWLDFLMMIVIFTSLYIWRASIPGAELFPDEREKWETQVKDSFMIFIISSSSLLFSIVYNNCYINIDSICYKCCFNDNHGCPYRDDDCCCCCICSPKRDNSIYPTIV